MEPMKRKITMKKVAGFQSFDLTFFAAPGSLDFRNGLGTIVFQNDGCSNVGSELAALRAPECRLRRTALRVEPPDSRALPGASILCWIISLDMSSSGHSAEYDTRTSTGVNVRRSDLQRWKKNVGQTDRKRAGGADA